MVCSLRFAAVAYLAIVTSIAFADVTATPTYTSIPDSGWRLLLDDKASWQNDTIYLPDDVDLAKLPANAPTAGWNALSPNAGIPVKLPATVEQYYWGKAPSNTLNSADPNDVAGGDGSYDGVSWWYRTFDPPALAKGEHLFIQFPSARLRAEVYVNGRLVGYDVVGETEFEADATTAILPGRTNLLAVRITNPGGRLDWKDGELMTWGKVQIPETHSFGGLAGGVTLNVRGPVAVTDIAVFNHPDPKTVTLHAELTSVGPAYDGPVAFNISRSNAVVWTGAVDVRVPAGGTTVADDTVTIPSAQLWDIGQPNVYNASGSIPSIEHSDRSTTFGFRFFTADGIGTDAMLKLNGRRIVVKSAISWGFWAPNGLYPDAEAAQRDVDSIKALGLNCCQNHRHMQEPLVLDAYDKAGIMRYCESGGGGLTYQYVDNAHRPTTDDTSGAGGEPTTFANRYALYKVLSEIRTNRSHPSVIVWNLQNENSYAPSPKLYYTLRKMQELDSSRIILSQSGFHDPNMVWFLPYTAEPNIDKRDGKGAGWNDLHTVGTNVLDGMYESANRFTYRARNSYEISMFGEMGTGASPDDHNRIIDWYKTNGTSGYDYQSHVANVQGYESFIDRYGFRDAFKSSSDIFDQAAQIHYFNAARVMENARISDANDYIVLSGWESTTADNHSGLVDELRLPKADPAPLREADAPLHLVICARHYVLALGDPINVDVHLINENVVSGTQTVNVNAVDSSGRQFFTGRYPVTVPGGNIFAQLVKDNISALPVSAGDQTMTATITTPDGKTQSTTTHFLVVDTHPAPVTKSVAYIGPPELAESLHKKFSIDAIPLSSVLGKVDDILIDPEFQARSAYRYATIDPKIIKSSLDGGLFHQQATGQPGTVVQFSRLASGPAKIELYFIDGSTIQPGDRVFDVSLNGQTVLKNFDIVKEAVGQNIGIERSFDVKIDNGCLDLSVPRANTDGACFAAIRVSDAAGSVTRCVFGPDPYTDPSGTVWKPVTSFGFDWSVLQDTVLKRVHDDGSRLIVLSSDTDARDVDEDCHTLAKLNIVQYHGLLGASGKPWLGRWYFAKQHWLFDGLPSNCVLGWQYQIMAGNGMLIDAPSMAAIVGYGINHDPTPAIGAAIVPYGSGQIVLFCIPGLAGSFTSNNASLINPVATTRLIYNSLQGG